jgi:S-adenosylmethionine-diacylgycerolhomoserine-N-methlytransferase
MAEAAASARMMDGIYRRQRHIYDLTRRYYLLGRNDLIAALKPPAGGSVLEIGCGTARNLVLTAQSYPDARLFGLDISSEMLKSADATIRAKGLSDRVWLAQGDAAYFDAEALFDRQQFDRVFFSYTLSMIPGWEAALHQACRILAPGGELHVVDFGQQTRLPRWSGRMLKSWLKQFHVTPRDRLGDAMQALSHDRGGALVFGPIYRDYARIGHIRLP